MKALLLAFALFATGCNLSKVEISPYQKQINFLASKGYTVVSRKEGRFVAYKNGIRVEVEVGKAKTLYIIFK